MCVKKESNVTGVIFDSFFKIKTNLRKNPGA